MTIRCIHQVVTQNLKCSYQSRFNLEKQPLQIQIQSGRCGCTYMNEHVVTVAQLDRATKSNCNMPISMSVYIPMQRNGDIRTWMSPPRNTPHQQATPSPLQQRRRRIIESDDSDAELQAPLGHNAAHIIAEPEIPLPPQEHPPPAAQAPVIELIEDSESDDMYIPLPQHRTQQDAPPGRQAHPGRQRPSPPQPVPRQGRRQTPARAAPPANNDRNVRRRIVAEAVESSLEDDDSSECIESDTDAQQMYREAILGVRNARNNRMNMRSHTTPCSVCAIFAQYLQHFIQR